MAFSDLVIEIDEGNYDEFLNGDCAILNFFSDWHMNCLTMLPIIEELAEEFKDKIRFGKVNIEEAEEIAQMHHVLHVPSMVIFRGGKAVDRIENVDSEDSIRRKISLLF